MIILIKLIFCLIVNHRNQNSQKNKTKSMCQEQSMGMKRQNEGSF